MAMDLWRKLLVEPQRPLRIRNDPRAPWFAVAAVCVGAVMGQLDASIVSLALPTLQREFGTTVGAVEWVALAYLLVLVSMVTAIGRVADMAGRKLLYTYGFGVFTLGSVLCGIAPTLPFLIGARVLQAVGAAMLQANSVALIVHAMPRSRLGQAIGIQGAAQAAGLALGPAVGGLLIALGGWRWIFLINLPIGLAGLALGWIMLPRSRELAARAPFDWLGACMLMPAIGALLIGISFGNQLGWLTWAPATLLVAGIALLTGFVIWERRVASPLVDLGLFRRPTFSAGIVSGLLSYLVTFGTIFVVPFALEHGHHLSSAVVGAQLAALPVALGIAAPFAGALSERLGARPLTVAGMLIASIGLAVVALLQQGVGLVMGLAVLGVGLGAFTPSNNAAIMAAAPRAESGVAAGLLNMTRGLGTALGVALTGLVYEQGGFVPSVMFLIAIALLAALLAAFRSAPPRNRVAHPDRSA